MRKSLKDVLHEYSLIDFNEGRRVEDPLQTVQTSKKILLIYDDLLYYAQAEEAEAQYFLGIIHLFGFNYSSFTEFELNEDQEVKIGSGWLEKAARQFCYAAVDNLVVMGSGEFADLLRKKSKEVEHNFSSLVPISEDGMPYYGSQFFEVVLKEALKAENK